MRQIFGSICIVLIIYTPALFAVTGNSHLSSEVYSFKQDSIKHLQFYQALQSRFILSQQGKKKIDFSTYARWRTDLENKSTTDPQLFVYDLQLNFKEVISSTQLSIGRQFRYSSIGSDLLDGVSIKTSFIPQSELSVYVGSNVNRLEPDKIQNLTENLSAGGYYKYKFSPNFASALNWFLKKEDDRISSHRLGIDANAKLAKISLYSRVSYDVALLSFNEFLVRGNYNYEKWQIGLEGRYREPNVNTNSVFSIIESKKYKRLRSDIQFKLNRTVRLVTQLRYLIYEDGNSTSGLIGIRGSHFSLFYNYQTGRGSENNGVSGTVSHKLDKVTSLYASANLARYHIQEEYDELSDAYSAAIGGVRTFAGSWQVRGEWQYLRNAIESYSSRIYFRLSKQFSIR